MKSSLIALLSLVVSGTSALQLPTKPVAKVAAIGSAAAAFLPSAAVASCTGPSCGAVNLPTEIPVAFVAVVGVVGFLGYALDTALNWEAPDGCIVHEEKEFCGRLSEEMEGCVLTQWDGWVCA